MKFDPWQIDKLIRGLHAYRVRKATDGRLLPWKTVHRDLLMSEKTAHTFPKGDEPLEFKEEALRRFGNGESTLQPDKLQDVWLFLIEARVLGRNELEEGVDHEALAIHAHIATKSQAGAERLSRLAASYRSTNVGTYETEQLELRFIAQPTDNLVGVEESVVVQNARMPSRSRRDGARAASFVRKGYGFTSSPHGTFHVFLRGGSPDDHVHYVSVTDPRGPRLRQSLPLLLRSGPPTRLPQASGDPLTALLSARGLNVAPFTASDEQVRQVLEASNILDFMPTDKRPVYAKSPSAPPPEAPSDGVTAANFVPDPERDPVVLGHQLIEATRERSPDRAAQAIADGADANTQDEYGMTALHHAAAHGVRPCIRLLVASGRCDYLIRDKQGRYAFELAAEWARDYALARLLAKKQAQQAAAQRVAAFAPR